MLVHDILFSQSQAEEALSVINDECRQFIEESDGHPLFKNLPSLFDDVHKIKVRKQKKKTNVTETFNQAFNTKFNDLRQRALFVYPNYDALSLTESQEAYYVFPIDGYRYMYNTQVVDSSHDYKQAFDTMLEQFNSNDQAIQILSDLLQYTYTGENLIEGLTNGAEIIMYNVPYYYAIRSTIVDDYDELLTSFA